MTPEEEFRKMSFEGFVAHPIMPFGVHPTAAVNVADLISTKLPDERAVTDWKIVQPEPGEKLWPDLAVMQLYGGPDATVAVLEWADGVRARVSWVHGDRPSADSLLDTYREARRQLEERLMAANVKPIFSKGDGDEHQTSD